VKVSHPEVLESEDGSEECAGVEARNRPEPTGLERASWAIAHALDLVVEVGELRKSVQWRECMQWEQVVQGAILADMVELFGHGECFLRTQEMGVPERPEEEMAIKKVRSQKSKGKGKEKEPEKALEKRPERVPEENSEVEGQDVEMTLQ